MNTQMATELDIVFMEPLKELGLTFEWEWNKLTSTCFIHLWTEQFDDNLWRIISLSFIFLHCFNTNELLTVYTLLLFVTIMIDHHYCMCATVIQIKRVGRANYLLITVDRFYVCMLNKLWGNVVETIWLGHLI